MKNILEVQDLTVVNKKNTVLVDSISFNVENNEFLSISGTSSSGRNAIINALVFSQRLGLKFTSGDIYFNKNSESYELLYDGQVNKKGFKVFKKNIAYISNPRNLFSPYSSVGSHVAQAIHDGQGLSYSQSKIAAIHTMQICGISDAADIYSKKSNQVKDGVLYRSMLALAMGKKPMLILADNPLLNCDLTIKGQFIDMVQQLRQEYIPAMLIVENLTASLELADRIAVMESGQILRQFIKRDFDQIYFDQSNMMDFLKNKAIKYAQ